MIGFTYNDIHSSTYNVGYIPDETQRWRESAEFDVYSKDVAWRDGGYYYGSFVKIRTIELSCYYEEITIAMREKIKKWLGRKTQGILKFDDIPGLQYEVRPGDIVDGKWYRDINELYSGIFTIKFTLVNPFGFIQKDYLANTSNMVNYSNILRRWDMPALPTTSSREFRVYNSGTEKCGLSISLTGSCDNPIRFYNTINGTECVFNSLPGNGISLNIDGETGYVTTSYSGMTENGYAYHDFGTVILNPGCTNTNALISAYNMQTDTVTMAQNSIAPDKTMIGRMTYLPNAQKNRQPLKFMKITNIDEAQRTITGVLVPNKDGSYARPTVHPGRTSPIIIPAPNIIVIQEKNAQGNWVAPTTLSLDSISIDYKPMIM